MIGRGTRIVAALASAALLAGGISACGGSGSDDGSGSTSSTSPTGVGHEKAGQGQGNGGGGQHGSKEGRQPGESVPVSPLHVSGGGSDQYRVKGGDNSIQDFGEESSEDELEAAATALHDFYVARAREDWRTACERLSKTVVVQIEQLGAHMKSGAKGCPATLAAITPSVPPKVARETTAVDAGSLRVEGDRGFLIYRDAEKTAYAINMASEGGEWKAGALAGIPLS